MKKKELMTRKVSLWQTIQMMTTTTTTTTAAAATTTTNATTQNESSMNRASSPFFLHAAFNTSDCDSPRVVVIDD